MNIQLHPPFILLTISGCYSLHLFQEHLNVAHGRVGSPHCRVHLVECPERSKRVNLRESAKVAGDTLWIRLEEGVHHRRQGLEERVGRKRGMRRESREGKE